MTREDIMETLVDLCREVFEVDDLEINDDTTAEDVQEWDSLTHLSLINEIEMEFGIKFTMAEIQGLRNVGELVDTIAAHL